MYPCLLHKFDDNASIHSPQKGSLEDKCADHQCYISSGSSTKDAEKFFNCISSPIVTSLFYLQVNDSYIVFDLHHTIFSLCCSIYRYKLSAGLWNLPTAVHSCSYSKYSQVLWRLPVLHTDLTAFTGSVAAGSHTGGYS